MPSFVRSVNDSTSSSDSSDSSSSSDDATAAKASVPSDDRFTRISTVQSNTSACNEDAPSVVSVTSPSDERTYHQERLLHAVLEANCIFQACEELNNHSLRKYTRDHPRVKDLGRAKYQALCNSLAASGLISPDLHRDEYETLREAYRQGLDYVSRHGTVPDEALMEVPSSLSTSLIKSNNATLPHQLQVSILGDEHRHLETPGSPLPSVLLPLVHHQIFAVARYSRDFDEIALLGKGGYGKVFEVFHRLDGKRYAVKKIPLSHSRIQKLQTQEQLDHLLVELRTLARLDHHNIVRYFGGWIEYNSEWRTANHDLEQVAGTRLLEAPQNSSSGHKLSFGNRSSSIGQIVFASEGAPGNGVDVFEAPRSTSGDSTSANTLTQGDEIHGVTMRGNGSPVLTLHIQMSVHPMTLSDFLAPPHPNSTSPQHCFHVSSSVRLLLAILNGIDYLHSEDVVHRDLKPDNIFLNVHRGKMRGPGYVDVKTCRQCDNQQYDHLFINPRIGDFGLVTQISNDSELPRTDASLAKAVGTEIYRPPSCCVVDEKLDIYALGVIAFELLWPLKTKMERHEVLRKLKQGILPLDFYQRIDDDQGKIGAAIQGMLCHDEKRRWSCEDVRECFQGILAEEDRIV